MAAKSSASSVEPGPLKALKTPCPDLKIRVRVLALVFPLRKPLPAFSVPTVRVLAGLTHVCFGLSSTSKAAVVHPTSGRELGSLAGAVACRVD